MDINEQEVFDFLEAMRRTGQINMMGARPYIEAEFNIPRATATKLLLKWMKAK